MTDPLSPAMRSVLTRMARAGHAPLHQLHPHQARQAYEAGAGVLEPAVASVARDEWLELSARDGYQIKSRLVLPALQSGAPLPGVLLYLHGGGFTIGSVATHHGLCCALANLGQCAVLSVDYRLAPEHRFPTAVNDAWDSLQHLHQYGAQWGLDTRRIAVGGDSAGGTLAAVCALMARDAGLPLALQLLFYPGTTAHQDTPSHQRYGRGFVLEQAHINYFFDHYIDRPDRVDWRFAPLLAPDVDGVAPAWFGLAECDPLVDEGVWYADRLRAAGVSVDLEIYRGVVHEFIKMGRAIPQARQAHEDAGAALRRAFA